MRVLSIKATYMSLSVYSRLYIFVIYKKAHTIVYLCANVKGIIMLIREERNMLSPSSSLSACM